MAQLSAATAGPPSAAAAWRAAAGPPASLVLWRAAAGPPPFPALWRAATGSPAFRALWRAPWATGEPPELHPKALLGPFTDVAESKKVRGRLRDQPDRNSSVVAVNAWFIRSRESHVCGATVSSAQCSATRLPPLCFHRIRRRGARRRTIPRASKQKDLARLGWRRSR